jgi:hypothetical protein
MSHVPRRRKDLTTKDTKDTKGTKVKKKEGSDAFLLLTSGFDIGTSMGSTTETQRTQREGSSAELSVFLVSLRCIVCFFR